MCDTETSKDALLQRLHDWHTAGEICEMLKIDNTMLLSTYDMEFHTFWEAERAREEEEANEP